jgi:hypothetical protein
MQPTETPRRRHSRVRNFARHYGEMVLAMIAGMIVLGMPLAMVLGDDDTVTLVNMGVSMTVPMVGWMRYRGHGWRVSAEMAAAMLVPTGAAIAVYNAGMVADFEALMLGEHIVMLAAMAVAMLLRPAEYLDHAHAQARQPATA